MRVRVLGGGIYGVTAALELLRRGHRVELHDPGPLPHPDAASTDISKLVRADYGADALYTELGARSIEGWHRWNASFARPLYHETGIDFLSSVPLEGFEKFSRESLTSIGFPHRQTTGDSAGWRGFLDGYTSLRAGWVESGAAVAELLRLAQRAGLEVRTASESVGDSPPAGVDALVVAAGAWTPGLLPELADRLWATAQSVLHFRPSDPTLFSTPRFRPWAADIGRTGWYGFCANAEGVVKVANHGPGTRVDPRSPRHLPVGTEERFRAFLAERLPALADAPLARWRVCLYNDSFDGDFFIGRAPDRPWLVVAAGDSGHGFKFAPVLGQITADAVEGGPRHPRFGWRSLGPGAAEAARAR